MPDPYEIRTPEKLTAEKTEHITNLRDFGEQDFDFSREAAEQEEHYKLLEDVLDAIQISLIEEARAISADEITAENVQRLKNLAVLSAGMYELVLGEPKPSFGIHALNNRVILDEATVEDASTPGRWNLAFDYNTKGQREKCGLEVAIYPTALDVFRHNGIPGDLEVSIPAKMEVTVWLPGHPAIAVILEPGNEDLYLERSTEDEETRTKLTLETDATTFAGSMRLMKKFLQDKAGQKPIQQNISTIR